MISSPGASMVTFAPSTVMLTSLGGRCISLPNSRFSVLRISRLAILRIPRPIRLCISRFVSLRTSGPASLRWKCRRSHHRVGRYAQIHTGEDRFRRSLLRWCVIRCLLAARCLLLWFAACHGTLKYYSPAYENEGISLPRNERPHFMDPTVPNH